MKNAHFTALFKYALILFMLSIFQTSYAQGFCKILEETSPHMAIAKAGDEYLILQSNGSIWRSLDQINWVEDEIDEMSDTDSYGLPRAMIFFDELNGMAASLSNPDASKASLYHTEDGGHTWTRSKLMLEDGTVEGFFPYQLFALDSETVVMMQFFSSNFYISHNRGTTWSPIHGYTQSGGVLMEINIINKDLWYLPTRDGLYKTTNQLESAELLIDESFIHFYASRNSTKLYGISKTYGSESAIDLYYSEDDFSTWEKISLDEVIPDLAISVSTIVKADHKLYIIEGDKMHYSLDDGQSWTNSNLEDADDYDFKITHIDDEIYTYRSKMIKFNCMTVGTEENHIENTLGVYPNPTTGRLFIKNSNHQDLYYTLFDLSGKKLIENRFINSVDLSEFDNGLYFMHIVNRESNESVIEKIVLIKD